MSIASEITRINTNIANSYTKVNAKGGTLPATQNSANLATAIDSIEVIESATAEGESLSLTNTKAMPYSDYVVEGKSEQEGEPSPSNPSEIHSVADDVNLFDISKIETIGAITNNGNNTITITNSYSTSTTKKLSTLASELKVGDTYILNLETTGTEKLIYLYGVNQVWRVGESRTITQADLDSYVFVYGENNQTVTISGIKIAKGTTLTPCSPYNQGTVTIKQRGKNLFDYKQIISSASMSIENGGFIINNTDFQNGYLIGILKNLCPELKVGDKFKFNWDTNATRNNSDVNYIYLNLYANTIRKDITYTCTQEMLDSETYFYGQQGQYYKDIIFYLDGQTSDYEPYQGNDYTFQTEPLRSLPNGVKDTMELQDMQNHTRIGRQTGTLTETTTITLSDAKTNGAYMCNIKPSGTLTGKTIELEAGDYEILYELAEEVIEPLTQNQANTMLDIIKTGSYEGTTNIYTDEDVKPTMGVGYYKKG